MQACKSKIFNIYAIYGLGLNSVKSYIHALLLFYSTSDRKRESENKGKEKKEKRKRKRKKERKKEKKRKRDKTARSSVRTFVFVFVFVFVEIGLIISYRSPDHESPIQVSSTTTGTKSQRLPSQTLIFHPGMIPESAIPCPRDRFISRRGMMPSNGPWGVFAAGSCYVPRGNLAKSAPWGRNGRTDGLYYSYRLPIRRRGNGRTGFDRLFYLGNIQHSFCLWILNPWLSIALWCVDHPFSPVAHRQSSALQISLDSCHLSGSNLVRCTRYILVELMYAGVMLPVCVYI